MNADAAPLPAAGPRAGRRRWGGTVSVRTKVLATLLVMSALGMLVAQLASFVIQQQRQDTRISEALVQEVEELRTLAEDGVDPATGKEFTTVEQLMLIALQRNIPSPNETYLALLADKPFRVSAGERPFKPEDEPEVMAVVRELGPESPVKLTDVQTTVGTVRLAVVQVSITGQPTTGTYVVAHGMDLERAELNDTLRTYFYVALGSLVLMALVGWLVAGRLLRPLTLLRRAAIRVDSTDLTERIPVHGDDDVSELTRAFNSMLDRLAASFETQRQFLDDAGHELRTPVTILRGHLELLDPSNEQDVAETRALLIDETDRMSRLVEDLILLAKTKRPDFLQEGPVELGSFTDHALDKARGLGDRDWRIDARADAMIVGDGQRLTQAVLQLASNAVKFTEPGAQIAIGSTIGQYDAQLWVRDAGIGIEPGDFERIFERFSRVDAGRGVEGSGLGLAIVRAIAQAHGGNVRVRSQPGAGTTFTISLPLSSVSSASGQTLRMLHSSDDPEDIT